MTHATRPLSLAKDLPAAVLVRVPFHEGELHAVRVGADVWISIRRVCEDLGIQPADQIEKLQKKPWAVVGLIPMTGPDSKRYETSCLHLDCLPMWLATIHLSRVNAAAGPRLLRFQIDAARVLRDHFFGKGDNIPSWIDPADPCPRRTLAASLAMGQGVDPAAVTRVCSQPPDASRSVASWAVEMALASVPAPQRARLPGGGDALLLIGTAKQNLGATCHPDDPAIRVALAHLRGAEALLRSP